MVAIVNAQVNSESALNNVPKGVLKKKTTSVRMRARSMEANLAPKIPLEREYSMKLGGYEIAAYSIACAHRSRNLYQCLELENSMTGILIGNASCQSSSTVAMSAKVLTTVGFRSINQPYPASVLIDACEDISASLPRGDFISAIYAILDAETHTLRYARAGHVPALLRGCDGSVHPLTGEGIALGLAEPSVFSMRIKNYAATIPPNGTVLMYSEGVSVVMNSQEEAFTMERLRQTLGGCAPFSAQDTVRHIATEICMHAGRRPLTDDITLIALKRTA